MKKFVIDHFDLRSKELKLLTVLEYIFMFCIVGLSLVLVNQSGEKLTEGCICALCRCWHFCTVV